MPDLQPATVQDAAPIRRLIWKVGINPFGLDWQRFIVIKDETGQIMACGQIKPHGDVHELASIAVAEPYRGQGLARQVIEHLLSTSAGPLYLTCRSSLTPFYQRFGFEPLALADMPPYFQHLRRIVDIFRAVSRREEGMQVMRRG
jgi:N-acetylglutamate synthase-like GNAT family acetyltransferase